LQINNGEIKYVNASMKSTEVNESPKARERYSLTNPIQYSGKRSVSKYSDKENLETRYSYSKEKDHHKSSS